MTAMADRLDRVVKRVNAAADTHCIVRLGETGHAAVSNGDGTITLDTTILWRLSEEGLAALVAHEVGHEALGHKAERDRTVNTEQVRDAPGPAIREREIELAADEFAGRVVAKAGYSPSGMAEILNQVNCPDWQSPLIRRYVSREQRIAAFQRAFEQAGVAIRPG
jgi:hypothetical protein